MMACDKEHIRRCILLAFLEKNAAEAEAEMIYYAPSEDAITHTTCKIKNFLENFNLKNRELQSANLKDLERRGTTFTGSELRWIKLGRKEGTFCTRIVRLDLKVKSARICLREFRILSSFRYRRTSART